MKADNESEAAETPINARLPRDVMEMLREAKKATGRSHKHLLTEAIRARYSKYLKPEEQAA